ncbi:MAG: hypothetical protein M3P30_03735 [Chloroflexota bacterium]|nr:hypothetical protein [Chloroflexota bacterium]
MSDEVGVRLVNADVAVVCADIPDRQRTEQLTLASLLCQAVLDSLGDCFALELCHRPDDVAVHAASGCAGVDTFLNRYDLHSLLLKPVAQLKHVAKAARQSVELPEHDAVETLRLGGSKQLRQRQPPTLG